MAPPDTPFEMDVDAIAEGICNSAPGSTIELLIDLLDALAGDGDIDPGILGDPALRRRSDGDWIANVAAQVRALSAALTEREAALEAEDDDEGDPEP